MPRLIHIVLTLLMVAMPTGGRFGSVPLDEEHEREHVQLKGSKPVAGAHLERRPLGAISSNETHAEPRADDPGFSPTLNPRSAELALRGAAERRML